MINNFTIVSQLILDKQRPFTGCGANDANSGFFKESGFEGMAIRCPAMAYISPRFSREKDCILAPAGK